MPDSNAFLHPDAIRRISRMELRARHLVEGFLAGMHRSPYFGQSIEFLQHRQYVPGDDLRHIDWKVWGRQDRLYIKQYQEDTNLRCSVLLDTSESMRYGRGALNKMEYASTIAACLSYLVIRQQDAAGLVLFDDRIRRRLPWRSQRKHLQAILDSVQDVQPAGQTNLEKMVKEVRDGFTKRGLMVLISDFLGVPAESLKTLKGLVQAGHDLLIFHVLDDDELDFPFEDPTRFEGMEIPDALACNPKALRDGYLESLQRFLDAIRKQAGNLRADYRLVRTSEPIDAVLTAFLAARLAHLKKG
ncbi:MAG: DUF58 domain-containing protein [Pirellulaceae bacterium]